MRFFILLSVLSMAGLPVFSQPIIRTISPASGPVGTPATIKGTGFDTLASGNTVFFGAVKAQVTGSTDSTISAIVPTGTTYQPVTVTTKNKTGYSPLPFVVTFDNGGQTSFTATSFLPAKDVTTGMYPHGLSLADFNGDLKPDLVVAKGSTTTVSVLTNTSTNSNVSFSSPLELTAAGNSHEASATGDLDGDGRTDLVVVNTWGTNSISVFRNTTTGTVISFAAKVDYATDNGAYSVSVGDFDGDGKPDIAVANNGSFNISIYKNRSTPGTIAFDTRKNLYAGTYPYSVIIGDLDDDQKPDLMYTTQGSNPALSVMKNLSKDSISFDAPVQLASLSAPFVLAMGDLDGDGRPDIVTTSGGAGAVMIKRNLSTPGAIAFSGLQTYFTTGAYPTGVDIADMNGDGKPDIVVANRNSDNVSVLMNTTSGSTISYSTHQTYAVGSNPNFVVAGDLTGDQKPEIIAANSSSTFVSVLTNSIGSNITPTIQSFTPASGVNGTVVNIKGTNFTGTTAVAFGGVSATSFLVNSDTTITANVGQGNTGNVSVTTPNGTIAVPGFTFLGPVLTSFTPTTGVAGTTVTINGVNFMNVTGVTFGGTAAASFVVNTPTLITAVVGNGSGGNVAVITTMGMATLEGFSFGAPTITNVSPLSAPVGDTVTITGTNFSTTPTNNSVFFGAVKAAVSTATPTQLKVIVPAGATYKPLTVTVNNLTAYSSMPFSTTFAVDSTRITTSSFSNSGDYSTGNYPVGVTICDLNGDGLPDLITANSLGNNISILKNSSTPGDLSLIQKIDITTGPDTKRTSTGDLDGDGKPDIVALNFNAGNASTISVLHNKTITSAISFDPKTDYSTGNGTIGLGIADINGDGKPDIVTAGGNSGFFSIFRNTTATPGTITFAPRQDFSTPGHGDYLTVADLDKDGRQDIIIADFSSSSISVYRNSSWGGNLVLESRLAFQTGANPSFIDAVDWNGDGKLDILVRNSGGLTLYKNNSVLGTIVLTDDGTINISATNIAVADLNGDSKPDLCVGRTSTGMFTLLENNYPATGTPGSAAPVDFKTGNFDVFVGAGDLNGDGRPEVIATNPLLNTATIWTSSIGAPQINNTSVSAAGRGDTLQITGANFKNATAVKFGGTPAGYFKVVSPTHIDAVVSGGASGTVTVTTPLGTTAFPGFSFMPVITAAGPTTFCSDSSVLLTSSADANNQWYKNGVAISAATAKTFRATLQGNYTVKTSSNGITTASASGIDITTITVPAPMITFNGTALVSSAASGNQWYFNGMAILEATSQTYQPTQSGNYTVRTSANGCTSALSTPYTFMLTGILSLDNGQFIQLYPNPVRDKVVLQFRLTGINEITIELSDLNGRRVIMASHLPTGAVINLSGLAAGIYIVRISSKLKTYESIKLTKTN